VKKRLALALAATAAVGLFNPALSAASPAQDERFWDILTANDIIPGPQAIRSAHRICSWVWNGGTSVWDAVEKIYQDNGVTYHSAEIFVAAAISVYCPPSSSEVA
jgi:hypothetical protein